MHQAVFSALRIPDVLHCQLPQVQLCVCERKFQQTKRSLRVVHKWSPKKGVFICTYAVRCGVGVWSAKTCGVFVLTEQSRKHLLCAFNHDTIRFAVHTMIKVLQTFVQGQLKSEGVVMGTHPWRAMQRSKGIKRHKKRLASVRVDEWVKAARKRANCVCVYLRNVHINYNKVGFAGVLCAHVSVAIQTLKDPPSFCSSCRTTRWDQFGMLLRSQQSWYSCTCMTWNTVTTCTLTAWTPARANSESLLGFFHCASFNHPNSFFIRGSSNSVGWCCKWTVTFKQRHFSWYTIFAGQYVRSLGGFKNVQYFYNIIQERRLQKCTQCWMKGAIQFGFRFAVFEGTFPANFCPPHFLCHTKHSSSMEDVKVKIEGDSKKRKLDDVGKCQSPHVVCEFANYVLQRQTITTQ